MYTENVDERIIAGSKNSNLASSGKTFLKIELILELVFIRSGDFKFSDSSVSMSMSEVECLIQLLCTS